MTRRRKDDNEANDNRYTLWVALDQRQQILKNRLPGELEGVYLRRLLFQLQINEEKPSIPVVESEHGDRTVPLSFRLDKSTNEFVRQWHELMIKQDMTLEQTLLLLLLWAVKIPNPYPSIETEEQLISFLKHGGQTYETLIPLSYVLEERLQGRIAVDRRANCPAKEMLWGLHESGFIRLYTASPKHRSIKQKVKRYRIHDGKTSCAYGHLEILPRATDTTIAWSPLRRMIWTGDILPNFPFRVTYRSKTLGYAVARSEIPLEKITSIAVTSLNQEQFYKRWELDTQKLGTELDGILIRGFNGLNFTIISKEIL